MRTPTVPAVVALAGAVALTASVAIAGDRVVASAPLADFDVPTNQDIVRTVDFTDAGAPISGVGLSAQYVGVRVDNGDGLGPWSLDVRLAAQAPSGQTLAWNPIGGDITIADYPFQDATGGLPGVGSAGTWTFTFDSIEPNAIWIYGLRDVQVHLLADAPEVVTAFNAQPDPADQWSRPFFIAGVSGLGPVAFDAYTFTVPVSGRYVLESVLPTGANHFTALYQDAFDPALPLDNLLDYGLGNGFSPFDVPRGTSCIEVLLFDDREYTWVTSQWSSTATLTDADNTITGPSAAVEAVPCVADFDGDGTVNIFDVVAFITNWNAQGPGADFNDDGAVNIFDVVAFITAWNAGCP